jgi:O-antigen/teichoic acid export membrane protein
LSEAGPRPFRRRVLVNTAWTGFGSLWAIVVSVVTLPLILHGLGSAAFGTWVLLNTFSATSGWFSLADVGVGLATTRQVAARSSLADNAGAGRIVVGSLALFVGLGVVFTTLFGAIGYVVLPTVFRTPDDLVPALEFAIIVFAVQLLVDQAAVGVQANLDGLQRVDLSRLVDAVRRTTSAAGVAALALAGGGLQGVALASLGGSVIALVVAVVVLVRAAPGWWRHAPRGEDVRVIVSSARAIAVLQPLGVLHRQMDRLVVGIILGPSAVTIVEIATQIQNGAEAVLIATSYAVVPAASWVDAREDRASLRELLVRGTKYCLVLTWPVVVGTMLLAGPAIRVWVGSSHASAIWPTVLALAYTGMTAPVQVASSLLVGVGRASAVLRAALGAVVINLVASVVLVHLVGVPGAFEATLLGGLFLVPFLLVAAERATGETVPTFTRTAMVPVLAPLAVMALVVAGVVLAPLRNLPTVIVGALLGGLVYTAVAVRFTVRPAELRELLATVRRSPGPDAVA